MQILYMAMSGSSEMKDWARRAFGKSTPWGAEDSPAVVTEVETALERQLSAVVSSRFSVQRLP